MPIPQRFRTSSAPRASAACVPLYIGCSGSPFQRPGAGDFSPAELFRSGVRLGSDWGQTSVRPHRLQCPAMGQAERLAAWMRERVTEAGAQGLVVGLSGGVDSAVVARLSQLAAPGAAVGVLMPCHSESQDERDAAAVATHFSLPTLRVDLAQTYDALAAAVKDAL